MKKTILVSAFALAFMVAPLSAKTLEMNIPTTETSVTVSKTSPFCMSIAKGDFETVKKLIDLGTNINAKSNGLTPAMYAAKFNRVDILNLLVEKGANLKTKSDIGFTALKYAKLSNAQDAIEVINKALAKK